MGEDLVRVKWPLDRRDGFIGKHSSKSWHVPQCVAGPSEYVINVSMYENTKKYVGYIKKYAVDDLQSSLWFMTCLGQIDYLRNAVRALEGD